ncbi:MAG: hypothetical protein JWN13_7024 [Betaproteobacteria bacterium]|jgi:sensor c-di-GMP phosphodiesterase-like protein|nr:hypothetical protein [Betaproteobacteria bacterium]
MARDLSIRSWAEGVESHEDWDFLQGSAVISPKAIFIAKPMSADAYLQWMSDLATDPTSIFIA